MKNLNFEKIFEFLFGITCLYLVYYGYRNFNPILLSSAIVIAFYTWRNLFNK